MWTFWTKKLNFDLWRRGLDYEGNVIKELQSGHSSGLHMTGLKSIIQQQRLCAGIGSIPNYNNIVIGFFTETKLSVKVFILHLSRTTFISNKCKIYFPLCRERIQRPRGLRWTKTCVESVNPPTPGPPGPPT